MSLDPAFAETRTCDERKRRHGRPETNPEGDACAQQSMIAKKDDVLRIWDRLYPVSPGAQEKARGAA